MTTTAPATTTTTLRRYTGTHGGCTLIRTRFCDGPWRSILVGFGAATPAEEAADTLRSITADLISTTGGQLDLLIIPSARWAHLSGFHHAKTQLLRAEDAADPNKLSIHRLWLAEDARDTEHRAHHEHELAQLFQQVRAAELAEQEIEALVRAEPISTGKEFTAGATSRLLAHLDTHCGPHPGAVDKALEHAIACAKSEPRYCAPGDPAQLLEELDLRVHTLAPATTHAANEEALAFATARPEAATRAPAQPFDAEFRINLARSREMPFFQAHYWGDRNRGEDQTWRRIDSTWMRFAPALMLDAEHASSGDLAFALETPSARQAVILPPHHHNQALPTGLELAETESTATTNLYTEERLLTQT